MRAERLSKIAVAAWAVIAVLIECYYASPGWPALRMLGPLVLVAFALLAWVDRRSVAVVAAAPYLFPAALYLWAGVYHVHYTTVWLAAMLGVVLPDAWRGGWHAPPRWSVPLACWAGVVAITAPIVVLRSADFHLELLTRTRLPHEALGGLTYQGIGWIGHVALVLVIGILWFDWLLSLEAPFFTRWVVTPFACTALVLAAVAAYQMLRDLTVLNPTLFASMGRATGTLFDANVTGSAIAYWIGGWTLLLAGRDARRRLLLAPILVLLWAGVWASSSRTASAAALIVTLAVAWTLLRTRLDRGRALAAVGIAGVLLALGAGVALANLHSSAVGPLQRFASMGETLSSPSGVWRVLWVRDGYGPVANAMLVDYPLFGTGIGTFHALTGQYARGLVADNAQNWYRHQLAELGVVGGLGWIVFVVSFGWWVVKARRDEPHGASVARVVLVVFALISLVAMPGQDPAIAITFWTMAAWYVHLVGMPRSPVAAGARSWLVALAVIVVAGGGTLVLARGALRPPVLAQHASFDEYADYTYGFWPPEVDDAGEFRWARRRGTIVVPAAGRQMTLSLTARLPDLATRPAHVKAWVDGRLVIDRELTADAPATEQSVILHAGERRVLIDTSSDRSAVAPAPDTRELALQVRWRFSQLH